MLGASWETWLMSQDAALGPRRAINEFKAASFQSFSLKTPIVCDTTRDAAGP